MNKKNNTKKDYAPTVKLYPTAQEGKYTANITDKVLPILEELVTRVELGGKLSIRPVNEAYKAKCEGTAPEFELTVYTAEEAASHRAFAESQKANSDGI